MESVAIAFRSRGNLGEVHRSPSHVAMEDTDLVLNLNTGYQPRRKPLPADYGPAATFRGGARKSVSSSTSLFKKKQAAVRTSSKPAKHVKFQRGAPPAKRSSDGQSGTVYDTRKPRSELSPPPLKKKKSFAQSSSLFGYRGSLAEVESAVEVQQTTSIAVDAKNEPVFSSSQFADFDVHPHLVACLRDRFQITTATEVQKLTIPSLLEQRDTLIKSHTGSGKTLAYVLPIVHHLQEVRPKLTRADGVRAVVVVPTRELALQTYEWFEKLCKACTWVVPGVLMGGEKKKSEKARLRKGLTIVVGTPGRLTDHLEHTESFSLSKTAWLVIDEADRLLELGFEESVSKIVTLWKEQREDKGTCVLLSATLTKGVERLAGLTLEEPVTVDVAVEAGAQELEEFVLPPGLSQYCVQVPVKLSQMALCCLLLDACVVAERGKVIVFLATQDSVDFEHALFSSVLGIMLEDTEKRIDFVKLHGEMTQPDRAEIFRRFREAASGVLFTTDVASRGIDVPQVDLIVQCCVPLRPEEYVHRAGRTARIGAKGRVVLLLFPSEVGFIDVLAQRNIQLNRMDLKSVLSNVFSIKSHILEARTDPGQKLKTMEDFVTALQLIFENEVYKETALQAMAKKGYLSHVRSYASYPRAMRYVVSFKALHLGHLAKAYCLRETPSTLGAQWASQPDTPGRRPGHKNRSGLADKHKKHMKAPVKKIEISEYDSGLVASKKRRKKHVQND